MQVTAQQVRGAVDAVAEMFGGRAAETIVCENGRKHAEEVDSILGSGLESAVVDLGGGAGVNLLVLRRLGHTGRLVLVDRFDEYDEDNRMGSRAHALGLLRDAEVEVVESDFWPSCELPLDAAAFDVACSYDVIEHLPGHPLRQLAELRRVLRPEGRILIGAPNAASLMKRVKLLAGRQPYSAYEEWVRDDYFEHYREYLRGEYEDLLRRAGFVDVSSRFSAAVTFSRAAHRYHRRRRPALSPTALALGVVAVTEWAVPSLRHTVYAEGRKPQA